MESYPLGFFILSIMKEIKLSQCKVALVDDEDFEYLNQFKWYANFDGNEFYVIRKCPTLTNKKNSISIHREIMKPPSGMIVDHINHDTFDNRKINLRICTFAENLRNKKIYKNNTSKYKGVNYNIQVKKWLVRISLNNKRIHVGYFLTPIEGAKAYNEAALKYHGEFANLNKID